MADLETPTARIRAALEGIFGPVAAIGAGFVAQRRGCLAAGAAPTPERLRGRREVVRPVGHHGNTDATDRSR